MKVEDFVKKFRYKPDPSVVKKGIIMCGKCNKHPANVSNWGPADCDKCMARGQKFRDDNPQIFHSGYAERVPDRIKEDRKKYFNTMVQPLRGGQLSKEYVDAYPELAKKQYGDKVKKAKNVWKDLPGWSGRDKSE